MRRIAVIGNVSLDIVFQVPRLPHEHEKLASDAMVVAGGGAPANVAHWLARLGHRVSMFGIVGTDPLSGVAVDSLAEVGVNVSGVQRVEELGPTVAALLTTGERKWMVGGGRSKRSRAHWQALVDAVDLSPFDHVHGGPQVHPLLFASGRRADLRGTVSADINGKYSPELVGDCDFTFTNHDEICAFTGKSDIGALVATDLGHRPRHLVVTRAGEEVVCYRHDGVTRVVPEKVAATDRAGAGDAFCAGAIHAALAGAPPADAIASGLELARATLGALGCRPATTEVDAAIAALSRHTVTGRA